MKTLIVYYSMEGNTEYAAEKIASELGVETLRIEPVKAYPTKGFRKFLWGGKSAVMAEKPKLLPYKFNADAYDRIIFGFPVWAGNITPPIRTFVIENNLKGKRIAAFACQSGSGAEGHLPSRSLYSIGQITARSAGQSSGRLRWSQGHAGGVGVSSHSRPLLNTGRITAGNARLRGISES